MKVSLFLKLTIVYLLLSFNLQAQQEWDYITSQFSSWQVGQGLYASSNSLNHLVVRNTTGEGIANAQKNLNSRSAWLNLNLKEDSPFEISFKLSNKKTDPYSYSQDQVYWGVMIELYKKDGTHGSIWGSI